MSPTMMPIKPISKDLLYMKVADTIHTFIHENHMQPGDKIPSERMLAEQLQIGRNSVREALRVLENEGLIEVKTGRGAFVANQTTAESIYPKLFHGNYFELHEIKTILEWEVIRKTIDRTTPKQLDQLNEILCRMERMAQQGVYDEKEDQCFHLKLLSICGNMSLEQLVSYLITVLSSYACHLDNANDMFVTTVPFHRILLDAMREKSVEKARAAYDRIIEIDYAVLETMKTRSIT